MVSMTKKYATGQEGVQSARADWSASWKWDRVELTGGSRRFLDDPETAEVYTALDDVPLMVFGE